MKQTARLDIHATSAGIMEMIHAAQRTGALTRATVRHTTIFDTWRHAEPIEFGDIISEASHMVDEHAIDFFFSRNVPGYSDELPQWATGNGLTWHDMQCENAEFDKLCGKK